MASSPGQLDRPEPAAEAVAGSAEGTRQRLLDAAEPCFARRGYEGTSVRDITRVAACNVASVNYHFGSKQQLYEQVFHRRLSELRQLRIEAVNEVADEAAARGDIELVIRTFAEAFLRPVVDDRRGPVTLGLLMREMTDPRLPAGMFLEQMVRPIQATMVKAMTAAMPALDPEAAVCCLHSLIGQLVHSVQVGRMIGQSGALEVAGGLEPSRFLEHTIRFTVAGIAACGKEPTT